MAEKKTNAMRILEKEKISYQMHTYDTSDGQIDGVAVARKCGLDPTHVYKTLVTQGSDHAYYVFVIPVEKELDLKACARSVGVKSVAMIHVKELLKVTGYIRGGCSPIGMKKPYTTVMDESMQKLDRVYVSGGRLGTQVECSPEELLQAAHATLAKITSE